MSFDIFLICFRDGEAATFKRTLFEDIFRRDAVDPRLPLTRVTYRDGGVLEIDGAEEGDETENMAFSRFGGETFFAALHELVDRSGSVLVWPAAGRSIAVTRETTIAHLPEELKELGPPFVVANGSELARCILEEEAEGD
jgi:hypothetical protein